MIDSALCCSLLAFPSRLELSALWVLPTAFVFVSYLQHRKDSSDKALALGIVKDPQVSQSLPLVLG